MLDIQVNFVAILVASVVSMVLGFLWYSPIVLGKPWMKEKGYTEQSLKKDQKEMGKWYGVSFVLALVTAYVLSHVMTMAGSYFQQSGISTGLSSAFWMWLGFIMPVQATATIFSEKKNFKLLGIDTGYQLVSILGMGIVLGMMG